MGHEIFGKECKTRETVHGIGLLENTNTTRPHNIASLFMRENNETFSVLFLSSGHGGGRA